MRRSLAVTLAMGMLLAACSSGPSLSEYTGEVEALVATMNARIDELDAETQGPQDLETIKWYAQERVAARNAFMDGMRGLDPPDEVADLHATALQIMGRLTEAETALAERVLVLDRAESIDAIWDTPEGVAARAADEQAIALCLAAQEELDETGDRTALEGVPWIPPEMREVVRVAFGCLAEDR